MDCSLLHGLLLLSVSVWKQTKMPGHWWWKWGDEHNSSRTKLMVGGADPCQSLIFNYAA